METRAKNSTHEDASFVCLWTGSKYEIEYVAALYRSVRRHCTSEMGFICVTDAAPLVEALDLGISVISLPEPLPGWWNKISLFDQRLTPFRHLVYIDLDVIILRSIDHLLENIGRAELVHAQDLLDDMSSSFMIIDTESRLAKDVIEGFDLEKWSGRDWGDQQYFQECLRHGRYESHPLAWEEHYSYKYLIGHGEWREKCTNPNIELVPLDEITMLNLHGYPKPHHIRAAPGEWPYADAIVKQWH
jgi:hypothetical protein